ncbi:MAG: 6,7-dimethyl-8-ribityllumazine synthase [Bacteroidota bacterium]
MSPKKTNLSDVAPIKGKIPSKIKIGIVVSEWNSEVTYALRDGAVATLLQMGLKKSAIIVKNVPGSFELPLGAQFLLDNKDVDAVICLGCVIQGETRHFEFICQAVSQQISRLNLDFNSPVIFGVLTTNTQEQALARSGGKHGNKGIEAAAAAIKMLQLRDKIYPLLNS